MNNTTLAMSDLGCIAVVVVRSADVSYGSLCKVANYVKRGTAALASHSVCGFFLK